MNPSDLARYVGAAPTWLKDYRASGGTANPPNDTDLADTGPMEAGVYDIYFDFYSDGAANAGHFYIEWRNALNTASNHEIAFVIQPVQERHFSWKGLHLASNERIRIYVYSTFTGTINGSILAIRRV